MPAYELIDTHCHIHDTAFHDKFDQKSPDLMVQEANQAGVSSLICVGTDLQSSLQAHEFARSRTGCYASLALHPHEAEQKSLTALEADMRQLELRLNEQPEAVVAIGECGLDFYYHESAAVWAKQEQLLKKHLAIAVSHNLPVIFHIRDPKNSQHGTLGKAFERFFDVVDGYKGVRGVIHSFSAGQLELQGALSRGFYVGLNGIMTFTKQKDQLQAAIMVPLEKLVLETDAPFLTPAPFRGKMCEPKYVRITAAFLSELRGESLEKLAQTTSLNAKKLFNLT